jgi:hypothetical protein
MPKVCPVSQRYCSNVCGTVWLLSSRLVGLFCMQCSICIVIARNTNVSALVTSGGGGTGSVVNSVKVVVVVSLSLHYRQCDKFSKIQQERAKWTGTVVLYGALHCLFTPWAPSKGAYYKISEGQRAASIAMWMMFGPVTCDLTQSEKFPLHQRYLKKTKCWTLDLWMLVGPVAGATPLARLQNLPRPQSCCRSGILLRNARCPKPIQISGLGTGTRLS